VVEKGEVVKGEVVKGEVMTGRHISILQQIAVLLPFHQLILDCSFLLWETK